ncbi:conserved hypothetical protein [Xenorhabdus bovienii SS-2004]|uniref:DUF551 domain-containing protein n=2 Tax=Xenorhabdus bovienii TaxID=40576 RepID=D3V019_XENBS|nr:DUF551 domain-containing protein [Xenorhabdus bovienii]CBJ80312.1 conserved hypothetical protein [Xenorhabdus bovienii SS-2004]
MDWIKCSERLPEIRDDSVIVYFSNGSMDMVHIEDCFRDIGAGVDENGNQLWTKWYLSIGITHWQPLPEPPTEE